MQASASTLLAKTVDEGIIHCNPAHLAKYANVANSKASYGKSERRISSSIHRLPAVGINWLWAEYCTIISMFFR
jgi:hypothetical protein